jgi:hypothetical protein
VDEGGGLARGGVLALLHGVGSRRGLDAGDDPGLSAYLDELALLGELLRLGAFRFALGCWRHRQCSPRSVVLSSVDKCPVSHPDAKAY